MHPINEWEGLSNKLLWIVASERSAIKAKEPCSLYNTYNTVFRGYYSKQFCYLSLLIHLLGAFVNWVFTLGDF